MTEPNDAHPDDAFLDRSPIHHVANIKGCLLIVRGMRDPNVTPENPAAVRRTLEGARVDHELPTFEDEGHGIRKHANNHLLYRRLAGFFQAAFADPDSIRRSPRHSLRAGRGIG